MAPLSTLGGCGSLVQGGWSMELPASISSTSAVGYVRPATLAEALATLSGREHLILAGGTDVYPAHVGRPLPKFILDISDISALRGIAEEAEFIRFGAFTTWSDIAAAKLPPAFRALQQAARQVGSIQVQNRGTIAGNLCNASPAADGVPPLLTLDAEVELASSSGTRRLPLASFITGYRQTAMRRDELVSAVLIPRSLGVATSSFVKLGARKYLVISIVMAAALVQRDDAGAIRRAAIAVGAASSVAHRLPALERALTGLPAGVRPSSLLKPEHLQDLAPITDVRASAQYRSDAALTLVARAIDEACHD